MFLVLGNRWGFDVPGDASTGCLGCGSQELFFGCADVAIYRSAEDIPTTTTTTTQSTTYGFISHWK